MTPHLPAVPLRVQVLVRLAEALTIILGNRLAPVAATISNLAPVLAEVDDDTQCSHRYICAAARGMCDLRHPIGIVGRDTRDGRLDHQRHANGCRTTVNSGKGPASRRALFLQSLILTPL